VPWQVVKNSQKLYLFFTGFDFGHKKKSVRKLNFMGFLGFVISLFFTARAGERFKKVIRIWSDLVGFGRMQSDGARSC
jgi:hypothetical protein